MPQRRITVEEPEKQLCKVRKEARELRKSLEGLTRWVVAVVALMDEEMKLPSTYDRGRRIARMLTVLEYVNDCARKFGLNQKEIKRPSKAGLEKARQEIERLYKQGTRFLRQGE